MSDITSLVSVEQLPIIKQRLIEIKQDWETKAEEAASLQATPDTLQAVKEYRTNIRKEFDQLDAVRKSVKDAVMAPYFEFETDYNNCVRDTFGKIDRDLKQKVDAVTDSIIGQCYQKCSEYFYECCRAHGVTILTFDRIGVKIGLTEAKQKTQPPKKLCEQISFRVECVANDLDAISHMDDSGEVLGEYQKCLSLAEATETVRRRKEEAARLQEMAENRARRAQEEAERVKAMQTYTPTEEPISAPSVSRFEDEDKPATEPMLTAVFRVTATRAKLIALREWMIQEGIKYE